MLLLNWWPNFEYMVMMFFLWILLLGSDREKRDFYLCCYCCFKGEGGNIREKSDWGGWRKRREKRFNWKKKEEAGTWNPLMLLFLSWERERKRVSFVFENEKNRNKKKRIMIKVSLIFLSFGFFLDFLWRNWQKKLTIDDIP